jgi:hypothetical protein
MAGVKIKILIYFFDMVPQPPALNGSKNLVFGAYLQFLFANASMMTENGTFFGTKSASFGARNMVLLETCFFSRDLGNQIFLFNNFNTATHAYARPEIIDQNHI